MKMSEALQICYGGEEHLLPLIREQEEREKALEEKPKFTPVLNYDPLRPFDCIRNDDDHFGTYVVREDKDLEVIVEVNGWTPRDDLSGDEGGPIFGNTWTVDGRSVDLTPEESERIAEDLKQVMTQRELP